MKIKKAFKYRLYPIQEQQATLAIQFGHARFVYNWGLAARKAHYDEHKQGLTYHDTTQMLKFLKRVVPWLKEADSQVLQQSLRDLDRAYKNFFEKRADYPRFKSKHHKQSIRYPQRFKLNDSHIYLPKVGWVKVVLHRPIEGKMKNCTVSKTKSGKYFISIQCEVEIPEPQPRNGQVGIDLGLNHFVTLSTGEKVETPKYLRRSERRLKIRQRRLSRKQKGSKSRDGARVRLAKQHERVTNQRRDFHHKLSYGLVSRFGFIAFESLNVNGMLKNHHLAKSIQDAGWSQFTRFCEYKAKWTGGQVANVDRFFPSSKLCSVCGEINHSLKLSDRTWICLGCGAVHDRDYNAATNILNECTAGAAETHAVGDMSLIGDSAPEAQLL